MQALRSFMDAAAPQDGGPYYMRPPASVVGSKAHTPLPVQLASQPALTASLDAQIEEPEHSPRFMRAGTGAPVLLAVGFWFVAATRAHHVSEIQVHLSQLLPLIAPQTIMRGGAGLPALLAWGFCYVAAYHSPSCLGSCTPHNCCL